MDILRKNLSLKILSILLATFLWAYVKYTQSPWSEVTSQASLDLNLRLENLNPDLVAMNYPNKLRVIVKGPPDVLENLRPEYCRAFVDLNGKGEGPYYLKVNLTVPSPLVVIDTSPSVVHLQLDRIETSIFPFKLRTYGSPAEGYHLVKSSFYPITAKVKGPSSSLQDIHELLVETNLQDARLDLVQRVFPQPVDSNGNFINNELIKISPSEVLVNLAIRKENLTLFLAVNPKLEGSLPAGYVLKSIVVTPPLMKVEVPGTYKIPPSSISTEPINLSGVHSSFVKAVKLVPPIKGAVMETESVNINVNVTKI